MKYGKNIPAQLHIGSDKLDNIRPIRPSYTPEKPIGGFWTSTYTPHKERESEWVEFSKDFMPPEMSKETKAILVRPIKTARILELSNTQETLDFWKKYGRGWQLLKELNIPVEEVSKPGLKRDAFIKILDGLEKVQGKINWMDVSKDYDAVRVIKPLLKDWDTESTLWFRNVFRKTKPILLKQ